jgi:hypothetical protein
MTSHLTANKIIIYLVLISFTAGCTSMRPLPATDAQSLASQIEVGDKIKIMRNDDTDVIFKVSAVSDEGISGDEVFVAYDDIRQVQVRQLSTLKTVGLIAAIIAVLVAGTKDFDPLCTRCFEYQ